MVKWTIFPQPEAFSWEMYCKYYKIQLFSKVLPLISPDSWDQVAVDQWIEKFEWYKDGLKVTLASFKSTGLSICSTPFLYAYRMSSHTRGVTDHLLSALLNWMNGCLLMCSKAGTHVGPGPPSPTPYFPIEDALRKENKTRKRHISLLY